MIPRSTPNGTVIVCIDAGCHFEYVNFAIRFYRDVPLVEGQRYILEEIRSEPLCNAGYAVCVHGVPYSWAPQRFRVGELPESLSKIRIESIPKPELVE